MTGDRGRIAPPDAPDHGGDGEDAGGSPLRRVLTLPWVVLYGLGSTVGAGIYVLTGAVAGRAGMQAPLVFGLAALLALFTAQSFAGLAARHPRAGGALVYVREGFGRSWLSVVVGLGTAGAGMVSAATVSVGFVETLGELWDLPPLPMLLGVVVALGALAGWGVRESVVATGLMTLVEVGGLLAILVYGGEPLSTLPERLGELLPGGPGGVGVLELVGASVLCFFAFLGFEDIVNVAEEVRDVRRALPRAILWTLGISTLLYAAVTTVAVLAVPPAELAASDAPLLLVFARCGGSPELLGLVALAAMINGALVQVIMASRVLYSLGREGLLPRWLGAVQPRRRTPLAATALVAVGVAVLAALLPLATLAGGTAVIALVVFAVVDLALVRIRWRERTEGGSGGPGPPIWVPAAGAVVSLGVLAVELGGRLVGVPGAP